MAPLIAQAGGDLNAPGGRARPRSPGEAAREVDRPPPHGTLGLAVATRRTDPLAAVLARLAAIEDRVARLETGKAAPGDGRAARADRVRGVNRCPGCGLPLRRRAGRCAACGRPVDSL
jgi:hypothetical protein